VARRLRGVPVDRVAEEGSSICAETISELRQIPGLAGVHVMAVGAEHRIPLILQQAGLRPLPDPRPAADDAPAARAAAAGSG